MVCGRARDAREYDERGACDACAVCVYVGACTWVRARGCVHVRAVPAMWAMHAAGQYERAQSVRGLGRAGGLAQTPKKNGR